MYTFLLVLLLLDSIVLVVAILLQAGKGGGLAAQFGGSGTDTFIGTRQAGNLLTKASWWGGGIFLALAFVLSLASTRRTAPRSVIEEGLAPAPVGAPATVQPGASSPALPLEAIPQGQTPAPAPTTTQPQSPPTVPPPNR